MHPDFETRMMWKRRTGLPMNVAIDDGYAYDIQQLPFKQIAFQMDTDDQGNMDNWNAMGLDGTLCDPTVGELQEDDLVQLRNFVHNNRYALEHIAENDLFSDQIANYLILGGEAASEEAIDRLKQKVEEIIAEMNRVSDHGKRESSQTTTTADHTASYPQVLGQSIPLSRS